MLNVTRTYSTSSPAQSDSEFSTLSVTLAVAVHSVNPGSTFSAEQGCGEAETGATDTNLTDSLLNNVDLPDFSIRASASASPSVLLDTKLPPHLRSLRIFLRRSLQALDFSFFSFLCSLLIVLEVGNRSDVGTVCNCGELTPCKIRSTAWSTISRTL